MTPEEALALGKLLRASGMDIDRVYNRMYVDRGNPILHWPILNPIRLLPGYDSVSRDLKCAQIAIWMQDGKP